MNSSAKRDRYTSRPVRHTTVYTVVERYEGYSTRYEFHWGSLTMDPRKLAGELSRRCRTRSPHSTITMEPVRTL